MFPQEVQSTPSQSSPLKQRREQVAEPEEITDVSTSVTRPRDVPENADEVVAQPAVLPETIEDPASEAPMPDSRPVAVVTSTRKRQHTAKQKVQMNRA